MTQEHIEHLNAALEGRYRLEREVGQGGMATVYLAHDLKHDRKVALKVLRPELAAVVGAERFLAEIKTTANLQHPHILPLFDSGAAEHFLFYVMPYVEGETLRQRLDREKQLAVDDAVSLVRKVADALDYAHEHGIVHRDIKPGNILLSERGEPLVADFGIALAVAQAGGGRMTETGLSLGTPHYMSPEQATGDRDMGPRSDVYSLGCVLYETLAGHPPFSASTAQAVLVKILTTDAPSMADERRTVPPHVSAAVAKSLEKLPADRFTSAADFASALADSSFRYEAATGAPTGVSRAARRPLARSSRLGFAAVSAVAVLASALAIAGWLRPSVEPAPTFRSVIDLGGIRPYDATSEVVISPDGSRLAVPGVGPAGSGVYVRNAHEAGFGLLPGTQGAVHVAFSPDSEWIVYSDLSDLLRVPGAGGSPQPVYRAAGRLLPVVPAWGPDGWITFVDADEGDVYRVHESGGEPELLLEGSAVFGARPLPGGRRLLFASRDRGSVEVLDLETDALTVLVPEGLDPSYVAQTGHLLWADQQGALWAAPFDPARAELTGQRSLVQAGLRVAFLSQAQYSVSRQGTLVYGAADASGLGVSDSRLATVWLDDSVAVEDLAPRRIRRPQWSPDGRFVAYSGLDPGETDIDAEQIYTYDMVTKSRPRRLTVQGDNAWPVWSPDGSQIAFASEREGTDGLDLFVKNVQDDAPPLLLLSLPDDQVTHDWPRDDVLLFESGVDRSLWVADLGEWATSGTASAVEYFVSSDGHEPASLAPQGDLVVYSEGPNPVWEVFVRSFPFPRLPETVSEGGGDYPVWSPDGHTIYYLNNSGHDTLYAARIDRGPPFAVVENGPLMPWRFDVYFDLHPDGDRFIASQSGAAEGGTTYVVTNWFNVLRRLAGS